MLYAHYSSAQQPTGKTLRRTDGRLPCGFVLALLFSDQGYPSGEGPWLLLCPWAPSHISCYLIPLPVPPAQPPVPDSKSRHHRVQQSPSAGLFIDKNSQRLPRLPIISILARLALILCDPSGSRTSPGTLQHWAGRTELTYGLRGQQNGAE